MALSGFISDFRLVDNDLNFDLKEQFRGTWLTESVEHEILNLQVVSSGPTLGVEISQK